MKRKWSLHDEHHLNVTMFLNITRSPSSSNHEEKLAHRLHCRPVVSAAAVLTFIDDLGSADWKKKKKKGFIFVRTHGCQRSLVAACCFYGNVVCARYIG